MHSNERKIKKGLSLKLQKNQLAGQPLFQVLSKRPTLPSDNTKHILDKSKRPNSTVGQKASISNELKEKHKRKLGGGDTSLNGPSKKQKRSTMPPSDRTKNHPDKSKKPVDQRRLLNPLSNLNLKKRKLDANKGGDAGPPKKRRKTRCHKADKHLCPVCKLDDCKKCDNCM